MATINNSWPLEADDDGPNSDEVFPMSYMPPQTMVFIFYTHIILLQKMLWPIGIS